MVEILPPPDVNIDNNKRLFLIVDPRAGPGSGIGGFKDGIIRIMLLLIKEQGFVQGARIANTSELLRKSLVLSKCRCSNKFSIIIGGEFF